MNLNTFELDALRTAIYPDKGHNLIYPVLGLCGEAGELANKVKKMQRDGLLSVSKQSLANELGDVLWYVAAIAYELGIPLDDIAKWNIQKLQQRQQGGTLQGSGDER